mmetsp:Transcript_33807/g.32877  ORF Transcript_33807/g.32877 Transcript_33807/m.32877 type:complete len:90 (+) Transcript_33807:440-709(+)
MVLKSTDCVTCTGDLYEHSKSTSYSRESSSIEISYGTALVTGETGTDSFYLDSGEDFGVSELLFTLADYAEGVSIEVSGIMGFARNFNF